MLIIQAIMGTYPFGGSSVLVLDLNGQYVYFFEALRDFVRGNASPLYSFSRALGGEFLGMYAYYLASPLSYLVALFPENGMLDALFLLLLLKQGLSGLSFGYYLKKATTVSPVTAVIFSTVYSLSAYGVVMQHNTMWTDNVILLPLIALGIRALVTTGRYKLYTLSLALALLSNFYIGYMSCIFCVLYFFYTYLSLIPEERNPQGKRLHFLRAGGRFAAFSLIAGAISMLIVVPAVYSLTFGKNTFSDPTYEFVTKLDIFDILTKFLFGSYDTVRPEGLPFVYCGIITLLLIPFYFISRRVTTREKGASLLLSLFLLFCFSNSLIDIIWHGGQAPNWLNYRYSFMLAFLMVQMAAKGLEDARSHRARWVLYSAAPLFFILILAEHFGYAHIESIFFPVGLNLLCLGIYIIALSLFILRRDVTKRCATLCLLLVVSVEMLAGGLLNIIQLDIDVTVSDRDTYYSFKHRWEGAINAAKETEATPFYRMELLKHRSVNDPFMLEYRGLSGSTSTLNRDTVAFLGEMGYCSASPASCYTGTNPFLDAFLGIKYVAGEASAVFPESYEEVYNNGDVVAYRNPNALPIAFGVAPTVHDITFRLYETDKDGNLVNPDDDRTIHRETSPFLRLNALAAALLGEEVTLFTPISHRYEGENVTHLSSSTYYGISNKSHEAHVTFRLNAADIAGKEIFAYFPTDHYTNADYFLNGVARGRHFVREEAGYLALGSYTGDSDCLVSFRLYDEGIYIKRNVDYFYAMDQAVYDRLITTLQCGGYRVSECSEDYFCGTITVREGYEDILTTIPYDKGWKIIVDGKEIEGCETLDALLAFRLEAGEHTLTLAYRPREYKLGLAISLAGTAAFGGIVLIEHFVEKKKQRAVSSRRKD